MVLTIVNQDRYLKWKALLNYCCKNRVELEEKGRMRVLVPYLQKLWQEAIKEIPDWF